jgi:hypothetical protein
LLFDEHLSKTYLNLYFVPSITIKMKRNKPDGEGKIFKLAQGAEKD